MNTEFDLFDELHRIILLNDANEKCLATQQLWQAVQEINSITVNNDSAIQIILTPGLPRQLKLVAPRQLKRRGIQQQLGRNILMHAIAHIEFNAINLALDAAYRFRQQPTQYYHDWIGIAADEARHFEMIRNYLNTHDCNYGDYPTHNGLWDMAVQTQNDIVARMALVPRVLEARGLDVTPSIIQRLKSVGDTQAVAILEIIYQDEIGHVLTGSHWFKWQCQQRSLEPRSTFIKMIKKHLHGQLKGPFNLQARLLAGFDEMEIDHFKNL